MYRMSEQEPWTHNDDTDVSSSIQTFDPISSVTDAIPIISMTEQKLVNV